MRLLITRPQGDADALATLLRERGYNVLLAPLLKVEFLNAQAIPLDGAAALIFTSANGVRAFIAATERRDLPCYAVGDRTATALSEAGFQNVVSAAGDVDSLAKLILAQRKPEMGRLLHIAGSDVAGDLAGVLSEAGFQIERVVLYKTAAQELDMASRNALRARALDGVLLFSPRTAHAFADQIEAASLQATLTGVTAWCLSAAVAHALGNLPFKRIAVAEVPTQDALLRLIDTASAPMTTATEPAAIPATRPKDDPVTPTTPSPPTSSRNWRRLPVYTVVVALAVTTGAATARYWMPKYWRVEHNRLSPPEPSRPTPNPMVAAATSPPVATSPVMTQTQATAPAAAVSARDPRLDRLTADLAAVQRKLSGLASATPADHGSLEAVIADQKSLAVSVAALETRVTVMEKRLHDADAAASTNHALLLAAEQLQQDLLSSAPYAGPLAVLTALGAKDPAIAAPLASLAPEASTGIESRILLAQNLTALARALAEPPALQGNASWWRRLLDRLERLIVIRHVADGEAALPEVIARNAAAALDQGDLNGAVSQISAISGEKAKEVAPWLRVARSRLAAETAADSLVALLTSRLTTPIPLGTAP